MKFKINKIAHYLIVISFIWVSFSFIIPLKENNLDDESIINSPSNYFSNERIFDGPYLFIEDGKVIVNWISGNQAITKIIRRDNYKIINRKFGFEFQPEWINELEENEIDYIQKYNGIENFIAISDIHGQYDVLVKLLKTHKVIDNEYNWIFKDGHLIVLGDILDRGPQVTESLWLIYRLEQQALEHGGKVHVLLGNHELMVLNNDARYINEKYIKSARLMNKTYGDLYSKNSFLGKWLHQKSIMVTINDILFVHAGVSTDYITRGLTRAKTNELFVEEIIGQSWNKILNDSTLKFLMSTKGPVWYRGYFDRPIILEYRVDHLLRYFEVNHIIVGHTSFPNIVSLYNGKIYGIDSNIKEGNYGELLIYRNNSFFRGTTSGSLIKISQ